MAFFAMEWGVAGVVGYFALIWVLRVVQYHILPLCLFFTQASIFFIDSFKPNVYYILILYM